MSLKQKTLTGLAWIVIDNFSNPGIQFIVGIILAGLLSPREFGLVGMIIVFIAVSLLFIDRDKANNVLFLCHLHKKLEGSE
ncbi:MAG: oligosaccharide flippase family protein [Candidatus Edwardsbacteria bacterium]|nr:oligosaccharide flippase family protein [Candidatus Edwardsbacteria bacterium]MBU1577665.1 oligosaccharide flippase family protein [Candidatus Edwardsbacteria bacterium]MBU2464035.1 oligosaccharide flippase family protein [Candidatus Edwardsbacteria bacterium]MBU2593886.1 oligosaccharide flippase family protein [Candidatus Edwardsbacteria bacterium]